MSEVQTNEDKAYTKARFFKCALQVNPAGYIKYRGQPQALSEDAYNEELLATSLEAGIEVIGLADHGSVDGSDKLRTLFSENGIIVFPGFEIASSEKIHFVCLFDDGKTSQELERILGNFKLLDPEDGIRPSRLSGEQLIDEVINLGGFIYAAHCTNDKGLLKLKMNHIWQHKGLLAAQIPGSIGDLKGIADDFYRKVFLNKDANYRREREIAAINAADVAKPEDIEANSASCLIKMTKPCFTSFKQAFLDAGSRVRLNADKPQNYASAIERIRFVGGYLDGVDIELSEHLNSVIGGRGTGKSTLLECIRFALNLQPVGKSAQTQHSAIIKANLGIERGLVELHLRSAVMHGRKFKVTRKYGDQPVVLNDKGNVSPYQPTDLLPGLELYGQNEIYEMTRDPQYRNQLVERFLEGDHTHHDGTIEKALLRLKENREALLKALQQKADIEADVERLPKLQDQAKQFTALGLDEKLKVVPKLEKERQLAQRSNEELERMQGALVTMKDSLPDITFLNDQVLEALPHTALLRSQRTVLAQLSVKAVELTSQFEQHIEQSKQSLTPLQLQLQAAIGAEEQQLEQAFKDIPTSQGKTGRQIGTEYQDLLKQIEQIKPKQVAMQARQSQINELYDQRKKLLLELSEARTERSSAMQKSVKRLNRKLDNKVRLTLITEGNRQGLLNFLGSCNLDGVGVKRLAWVADGDFSPVSLANEIRSEITILLGATQSVCTALQRLPESKLLELEELSLPDNMEIELNVTHGNQEALFRKIDDLSTGQQCTAVLHLLLLDNHDPLILDQPEDNLDNAFIAERIVAELRKAKLSRQFLFATHNANIPVFGDAEWIGVLSVEDNKGHILQEQQGAIDLPAIQQLAADILEGGKSAFNQRREKYGFE
ncbi:TrlF family AAA-like ATPase [Pseudomonadota bacterium]